MKRRIFTCAAFLFLLCAVSAQRAAAEEWCVYVGSFMNRDNAQLRKELLAENGIPTRIIKHQSGNKTFYRLMYDEVLPSRDSAALHREMLENLPAIRQICIDDIWFSRADTITPPVSPEQRTLSLTDSDTGNPVADADVDIDRRWNIKTDWEGKAPIPPEVGDGEHSFIVSKGDEYVRSEGKFLLLRGKLVSVPQVSIPKAVDYERIKIILDWGEYPSDLDSHIVSGSGHVSFRRMNDGNMNLDRDDTSSYGPETITIKEPLEDDVYSYYVFNYSDRDSLESDRLSYSGAQVQVFFNNEFQAAYRVLPGQSGITWHVFDIVNGNEIVIRDQVLQDASIDRH